MLERPVIYVCNIEEMPEHARVLRPRYLASLVTARSQPPTPPEVDGSRHLRLELDDISTPSPGQVLPGAAQIRELIEFLSGCEREAPILLHCIAGVSRSTAAALVALVLDAEGREAEAVDRLGEAAPHAWPNRRIVALADEILSRDGRLVAALDEMILPESIPSLAPLVCLERLG